MATTIILGIVSIGILIFVHELGHFLAARMNGIQVEVFSIGWGKGIVSFNWKGTKIQIGWIPFGGYCKMAGDSPRDSLTGSPDEFYSSPPYKRVLVALGGPVFNYVFAMVLFILIVIIGYQINTFPNKIVLAREPDKVLGEISPAKKAGMKDGDVIIAINGKAVNNWDDITEGIVRNALKPVTITVRRNGRTLRLVATPKLDRETGRGLIGIHPWVQPIVGGVTPGGPAGRAGIQTGDRILSVDGVAIKNHIDFYDAVQGKAWKDVTIVLERKGEQKTVLMMPEKEDDFVSVGMHFRQITVHTPHYPFFIAVGRGVEKSAEAVQDTIRGLLFVISGKIRAKSAVAGPAKLIYISGVIAKEGFSYFLQVMGYISIAFFIMNLIPFPALDGSHIVIALYEAVTRKKPNIEVVYKIQTFGFIILVAALLLITMNDISSFFKGNLMP
jgi:regulator of sigma E protease